MTEQPNGKPAPKKHPNLMPPWKPGQSGNPKGRAKGARNKLGEAFLEDMYEDWKEHGTTAISACRKDKPDAYLRVIAGILPQDVNINVNAFDEMSDDDLINRIRALDATIRPFLSAEGKSEAGGGTQTEVRH